MRRSARSELMLAIAATAVALAQARPAAAQSCGAVPPLDDEACRGVANSIDGYKACYRELYDHEVIPAFRYVAQCSHERADKALKAGLESAGALVTGTVKAAVDGMARALAAPTGTAGCIRQLNEVDAALEPILAAERAAPDLPAYRRSHYGPEHFASFTNLVLGARANRAACGDALLGVRKNLVLLAGLKAHHLDYCQVLRDSARYEDASRIQSLAQWTAIDPAIHFDQYFNASVTWNTQCNTFDTSGGTTEVHSTPCLEASVEYRQTLSQFDDSIVGWLSDNRAAIIATASATASTIAIYAGYGAQAGPIGAAAALVVGLVIAGLEYWSTQNAIDELDDLIADKERELANVVRASYITAPEFAARLEELCAGWQPVVEARIATMLGALDPERHIATIDAYFALSDKVHDWYNELLLWATSGPPGQRFLDHVVEDELLAQRAAFDNQLFAARTGQEVAAQENALANVRGSASLIACAGVPVARRAGVRAKLQATLAAFNQRCEGVMDAIGVHSAVIPFTDPAASSDVTCSYTGFRGDVATVEVRAGAGFSADLTLRDAAGAAIAELTSVTSETAPGFPGFACESEGLRPFGTTAASVLTPGSYPLRVTANIYGFGAPEAQALRPFLQDLDSKLRTKAVTCRRQLEMPITLPRTADACGIPTNL